MESENKIKQEWELMKSDLKKGLFSHSYLAGNLYQQSQKQEDGFWEKASDRIANFVGSWTFIASFFVIIACWMIVNSLSFSFAKKYDPYPFILLNLVLSCIAAVQAPLILMSQRRKDEKDRARSESDYLINLQAEQEVREIQGKVNLLLDHQLNMIQKIDDLTARLGKESG